MHNLDIKAKIVGAGVKQWQVADQLGISVATFTRIMRHPLAPEKKSEIIAAIQAVSATHKEGNHE